MFKIGDRVKLTCAFNNGACGVVTKLLETTFHEPEYRVKRDHEDGDGLWFRERELKLVERVMEKKTFEVGKVYEYKGSLYTCLGVHLYRTNSVAGVMRFLPRHKEDRDDLGDIPHVHMWNDQWVEYMEPKVMTEIRYPQSSGGQFSHYRERQPDSFAKVEIIHTEGVGVEYKVLEYYPPKKG